MKYMKSIATGLYFGIAALVFTPASSSAMTMINTSAQGSIIDFLPFLSPDGVGDQLSTVFMDVTHNTTIGFQVREARSFMEYNIGSLTGPVAQATITINTTGPESGKAIDVYGYVGNGTLELGDFGLGTLVTSFIAPQFSTTFDVTAFINAQIAGAATFAGFNLRLQSEDTSYISQLGRSTLSYPILTVDESTVVPSIPEPGALALFGLGLATLGFARRRKAAA